MEGVADPKIHAPPYVLPTYQVKFDSSMTKGVRISRREPQNCGALGPRPTHTCYYVNFGRELPEMGTLGPSPLTVGASVTPINTPLPICVILPNFVVLHQTVPALLRRST